MVRMSRAEARIIRWTVIGGFGFFLGKGIIRKR